MDSPRWFPNGSVRFELRELNTVSVDKNSFDGTYDQKFFDADGNVVFEDMGTTPWQRAFLLINSRVTQASPQLNNPKRASSVVENAPERLSVLQLVCR